MACNWQRTLIILMQKSLDPRELAAFVGNCSYSTSGEHRLFCTNFAPLWAPALRKLLYLAACSVRTHRKEFKQYFLRKTAEGKPGKLVLNNIPEQIAQNRLPVVRSQKPFIPTMSRSTLYF